MLWRIKKIWEDDPVLLIEFALSVLTALLLWRYFVNIAMFITGFAVTFLIAFAGIDFARTVFLDKNLRKGGKR